MTRINVTVDGVSYSDEVEPRTLLVQYLRESLGKTGTVIGCDTSNCGACTVHLDGASVKSCNVLAVQADGHEVTTIEGLATDGELHPVQQAFHECHALQCGYCTPGMIMQACDVLKDNPDPSEQEIREGLEGNLCRCTGYHNIVKAVQQAAGTMAERVELAGGVVMTITEDRPADAADAPTPRSAGRARARRTSASSPAAPGGPTTSSCPACCTSPWCAAPSPTPRITAINTDEAKAAPGVVAVVHRRGHQGRPGRHRQRLADQRRAEDARTTCPSSSTTSRAPARSSPSSRPAPRPRPATPPSSSTSTTTSCPAVLDLKEAVKDEVLAHPDLGTNTSAFWTARLGRPRGRAPTSRTRSPRPATAASSSSASTASSGSSPPSWSRARRSCDPTGEQMTMWSSTQVPHILRFLIAATTGIPESKVRVIAPDVGGGFGGKLQTTPEEFATHRRRPPARQAVQVHRDPLASRCSRATTAATSGRS